MQLSSTLTANFLTLPLKFLSKNAILLLLIQS